MLKQWIDPNNIYLASYLNPRELNQGFIESLVESMQEQGFLPQYPVGVFKADTLTCLEMHELDKQPYVCVSGMHRTTAAQLAKIDKILCKVYDGDDDLFIEMMMTDNLEHDPARNSEIGQVFTQREKRTACQRLLYIPKFFRMTNSALGELWHTSETNVRRWRKEVASSFDEGSGSFIPAKLRQLGVTVERLQELMTIHTSQAREDAQGNVIPIRTAPKEPTDEEKSDYWDQIRKDAGVGYYADDDDTDRWLERHGINKFDHVREYIAEKYGVEEIYRIYEDLTMRQLRDVHGAILSDDAEFIAGCKAVAEAEKKLRALKTDFRRNCGLIEKWLLKEFVQGNEWSESYKQCRTAFTEAARENGHPDYCEGDGYYPTKESMPETYERANEIVLAVQRDIAGDASWILVFRDKMEKETFEKRQKLEKDWVQSKKALAEAFTAYPRNISPAAFCAALDGNYYAKAGTHFKLFGQNEPSSRVHDQKIKDQISQFKRTAKDLKADADWVKKIPVDQGIALKLDEYADFEISHIYIEVKGINGKVFHPDGAEFTNAKYDLDEDGNLKSKGMNLDAEAIACLSDATKANLLTICRKNKFSHYTSHFDIQGPREEDDGEK